MMSSLVPGPIFMAVGFNHNSTPTPPGITPEELERMYRRENLNGKGWPPSSPISRAYDVTNTSTKLILLNNKYGKNCTRLRGYFSGPKKSERHVDPNRHSRVHSATHAEHHSACFDSSSPKFKPSVTSGFEWTDASQRLPHSLMARSFTNHSRHISCKVPPAQPICKVSRSISQISNPPNRFIKEFSDMTAGERLYLWSIEKVYNLDKMKQLKQEQYHKLLDIEARKGYHGFSEYTKYLRYINSAKNRTYGTSSPPDRKTQSANYNQSHSEASKTCQVHTDTISESDKDSEKSEEPQVARPQTALGHTKNVQASDTKQCKLSPHSSRKRSPTATYKDKPPKHGQKVSTASSQPKSVRYVNRRASSASSSKHSEKLKSSGADNNSITQENEHYTHKHKEGLDRPKSRLGHPQMETKEKEYIQPSMSSIKSDSNSINNDSGIGNEHNACMHTNLDKTQNNKARIMASLSNKSSSDRNKSGETTGSNIHYLSNRTDKGEDNNANIDSDEIKEHHDSTEQVNENETEIPIANNVDQIMPFYEKENSKTNASDNEISDNKVPNKSLNDVQITGNEKVNVQEIDDEMPGNEAAIESKIDYQKYGNKALKTKERDNPMTKESNDQIIGNEVPQAKKINDATNESKNDEQKIGNENKTHHQILDSKALQSNEMVGQIYGNKVSVSNQFHNKIFGDYYDSNTHMMEFFDKNNSENDENEQVITVNTKKQKTKTANNGSEEIGKMNQTNQENNDKLLTNARDQVTKFEVSSNNQHTKIANMEDESSQKNDMTENENDSYEKDNAEETGMDRDPDKIQY